MRNTASMKKFIVISILAKISVFYLTMALAVPCGIGLAESPIIYTAKTLSDTNKTDISIIEVKCFDGPINDVANRIKILRLSESPSFPDKNGYVRLLKTSSQSYSTDSRNTEDFEKFNLRPIQKIVPYPYMSRETLPFILFSIFSILGVLAFLLIKILKNKSSQSKIADTDYCHNARIALQDLEKTGLYEAGKVKEYYKKFALIIKAYIENSKALPAKCLTCEELRELIRAGKEKTLLEILSISDQVKFGFEVPQKVEKDKQVGLVLAIFEEMSQRANS